VGSISQSHAQKLNGVITGTHFVILCTGAFGTAQWEAFLPKFYGNMQYMLLIMTVGVGRRGLGSPGF